ncbi:MAG: hypothetical protein ACUVSX_15245 [Aggregatilineales bacterium]
MWLRKIVFPARITLQYKAVRGVGIREAILLAVAALQAVYLVFLAESVDFVLRLCLALFLAIALVAIATVPIKGYRMEQYILVVLRGLLRPKVYLHQTAQREEIDLGQEIDPAAVASGRRPPDPAPVAASAWEGDWAAPNLAMVMAVFLGILILASLAAFIANGGQVPGLTAPALEGGWR